MENPPHDRVDALYQKRNYPPMSHPVSDPALSAAAARIAGLRTPPPIGARILEIGCGSGHNLIPLARRWPGAVFTGIDLSIEVIATASRRAADCGVENIRFITADLRTLEMEEEFDYIIAHGFFSWVADDVKAALLRFCAAHLSPSGIATISFNVLAGWRDRLPVIAAVRRICDENGVDEITALNVLRTAIDDAHLRWIIDDMLAKGPEILVFDDFAPVSDPWPLDRFAIACTQAGLRWLGESDPAENIPSSLDEDARAVLMAHIGDPLKMQMEADKMAANAFRSGLLCRRDAPLDPRMSTALVLDLCVSAAGEKPTSAGPEMERFYLALEEFSPACVPVAQVLENLPGHPAPLLARLIFNAITHGHLRVRIEPLRYSPEPPSPCRLDPFRLLCAREKVPLVDAWHIGCAFPEHHYSLLAEMDGTRSIAGLTALSKSLCPDLDFAPWLAHLAARGMFA